MITLYGFGPMFGLADPSPFVVKAIVLLKMSGQPFTVKATGPLGAPKGKLPYIEDEGVKIADSHFIREHLAAKYRIDFDAGLTAADKALGWAIERMVEDHLYWGVLAERWADDENFACGPAHFFDGMPALLRPLVRRLVRRKVLGSLNGQGLGRHSVEERNRLIERDIDALARLLGDRPFVLGDSPTAIDATVFAFIDGVSCEHFKSFARSVAARHPNLAAYRGRMIAKYFADAPAA